MKRILVATDFSERSDRALGRATRLALQFDACLTIVHVIDDDQPRAIVDAERDQADKILAQIAANLRDVDGLTCDTRIVQASPFVGIARAVADAAADLLVIGSHRRQVLRDVFVGTTAERTIRSAGCPILMANATPDRPYRRVMLTTDLSEPSGSALRRFAAPRLGEGAEISLFHAFEAPALRLVMAHSMPVQARDRYLADERKTAARELARFADAAGLGDLRQVVRHEVSSAPAEILNAAQEEQAELIVLSTHGRGGVAKFFTGSVTEQVLRTSPVDVLAMPPTRGE